MDSYIKGITLERCCLDGNCLIRQSASLDYAELVMLECYKEVEKLHRIEKKNYLRDKVSQTCITGNTSGLISSTGKFKYRYSWTIGRNTTIVRDTHPFVLP